VNPNVREILAAMTSVNSEMARYIGRSMDVANGMTDAGFPIEREALLGEQLVALGCALQARAADRAAPNPAAETTAIEPTPHGAAGCSSRSTNPSPRQGTRWEG
jgi:hypothetical protein